jgi:DNA primase
MKPPASWLGVAPEAIKLFRLGAAPDLWDDTVNWAKNKSHDLPLVEKAGLIIQKSEVASQKSDSPGAAPDLRPPASDFRHYYDRFRGRLMFPICDEQGRVIGFSGRVLSGDEKTAKYVNSPETPIFTKSKVFFGLDKSKRAILDAGFAIICEGQLDLIGCFMAGVQNIVAPQGTAFTDQHARILKRYVNEVVLCFDSDEAGQNAAVRSLDHLLASGLAVRVAVVPAPHDPDSFIKANGGEAFRKLVESADGFFDYYLSRLCAQNDLNSDKGRNTILRGMGEAVHKTGNSVLIDTYAQKTALRLGVAPEAVRAEFKKVQSAKFQVQSVESDGQSSNVEPEPLIRPLPQEFWLLKLLLLHDELATWAALHLDANWIVHPLTREIVLQRFARQKDETWKSLAAFLDGFETREARDLMTEAAAEDRKIPNPEQQLADVALKLRNQFLDRQIAALTQKACLSGTSETEKVEWLRQQQKLREQKRAPLSPL